MPAALRKYGFRFHFYGADAGEPPHIHAYGHGGQAKIWLDPVEKWDAIGLKQNDLNRAMKAVEEHQDELMEAWNDFFKRISGEKPAG
ncbi:MAG: DUF4160 domain-containing protein [Ahrensia sp.]|nr:DUF4160 domain-containing protein [Ahrensia sp.]